MDSDKKLVDGRKFQALLCEPLVSVVGINVAVLTLTLGVVEPERVQAVRSITLASVPVIAVVAHPFGKMLQMRVLAVCNLAGLTSRLTMLSLLRLLLSFLFLVLWFDMS